MAREARGPVVLFGPLVGLLCVFVLAWGSWLGAVAEELDVQAEIAQKPEDATKELLAAERQEELQLLKTATQSEDVKEAARMTVDPTWEELGNPKDLTKDANRILDRLQSQEELKEDLKNGDDKEEEEDPVAVAKSAVKKMKRATQKAMSSSGKGKGKGKGRSRKGRKAEGGSVRKILQKRRKTVQIQIPEELSKTLPVERKPQRIRKFLEYSNGRLKIKRVLPNKEVRKFLKSKLVRRLLSAIVGFSKSTIRGVKSRIYKSVRKAALARRRRDRFARKLLQRATKILPRHLQNKAKLVFPKLATAFNSKWRFRQFVHTLQAKLESAKCGRAKAFLGLLLKGLRLSAAKVKEIVKQSRVIRQYGKHMKALVNVTTNCAETARSKALERIQNCSHNNEHPFAMVSCAQKQGLRFRKAIAQCLRLRVRLPPKRPTKTKCKSCKRKLPRPPCKKPVPCPRKTRCPVQKNTCPVRKPCPIVDRLQLDPLLDVDALDLISYS